MRTARNARMPAAKGRSLLAGRAEARLRDRVSDWVVNYVHVKLGCQIACVKLRVSNWVVNLRCQGGTLDTVFESVSEIRDLMPCPSPSQDLSQVPDPSQYPSHPPSGD